ncbi:surface antigen BspA-like [Trichomonas vaginalis G3]|uniref:Surface antigen BspA-like n=1 Tax=Trichomonas vaginalis (strain ATCC PRA-98 / G3) TaxID=412133 RepID=A2E429_TRIV3|nr:MyD88-dependent toll-like receptor signaling pathway [Trichomonas vaginalis G3]EAY12572.1 surface antigen BspA-like [Trichomonas vaginalis G3]KAI5509411.1 MyD88-dependent toll-like receptor signaling pathway [Trichomonas vaginalis G3]|eukprot:XP_001324795.1 surface antigen BspA-like [Trichomonas vaginalis G3]
MISLFFSLAASVFFSPAKSSKKTVSINGTKFECTVYSNKTIVIGNGQFEKLEIPKGMKELIVPETIMIEKKAYTVIGVADYAFSKTPFELIRLTPNIQSLGKHSFENCPNLHTVDINQSKIHVLPAYCFNLCPNLQVLIIGSGLVSIEDYCFNGTAINTISLSIKFSTLKDFAFANTQVSTVHMHLTGMTKFGKSAFANCYYLKNVTLPKNLVEIPDFAFLNTGIKAIAIPQSVKIIGESAFQGCKNLKSISFEGTDVTEFPKNLFNGCVSLEKIVLPAGLEQIHDYALARTKIQEFVAPASLKEIGKSFLYANNKIHTVDLSAVEIDSIPDYAFSGCTSLTTFKPSNGFSSVGVMSFAGCAFTSFPFKSVTTVANASFANCSRLTDADLSNLHRPIIPPHIFYGCSVLEVVKLPHGSLVFGDFAFAKTAIKALNLNEHIESIGIGAFSGCTSLISINLIELQMKELPAYLLYNVGAVSVSFPSHPVTLGDYFFSKSSIRKIVLTSSVTSIGKYTFANCTLLTTVDMRESMIKSIPEGAFINTGNLEIQFPISLISVGQFAFADSSIVSLSILEKVFEIGNAAFQNCKNLETLDFSDCAITELPERLCANCNSLKDLALPPHLKRIHNFAFKKCGFHTLLIPASLEQADTGAFMLCSKLELIDLSATAITYLSQSLFSGCNSLQKVILPEKLTNSDKSAFENCDSIKEIHFYGESYEGKPLDLNVEQVFVTDKYKSQTFAGIKVSKSKSKARKVSNEQKGGIQQSSTIEEESHTTRNAVICVVVVVLICIFAWHKFDPYDINGSEGVELEGELPFYKRFFQKIGFSLDRMASRAPTFTGA